MNHEQKSSLLLRILRILSLLLILAGMAFAFFHRDQITVENLLRFSPDNPWLAAGLILLLYAVKSLTFFFPLLVLYIGTGILFPPLLAILINSAGLFLCISIPYALGRFAGKDMADRMFRKYKKAQQFCRFTNRNEWFLSYILRAVNLLPGDAVSMLLGAMKVRYLKFASGSLAGLIPSMIAPTFIGATASNPRSPAFIISCTATVVISAGSILLYRIYLKRQK